MRRTNSRNLPKFMKTINLVNHPRSSTASKQDVWKETHSQTSKSIHERQRTLKARREKQRLIQGILSGAELISYQELWPPGTVGWHRHGIEKES